MRFYLEYNHRQQCYKIFDMQDVREGSEPVCLMTISARLMDKTIAGYLIANGAIQPSQIKDS